VRARLRDKLPLKRPSFGVGARDDGPDAEKHEAEPKGRDVVRGDRRALIAVAAAVVIVLVVVVAGSGGQPVTPPAIGAASVVPSDALAYVHLSTDDSRPGVRSALTLADRFPGYTRLRDQVLAGLGGAGHAVLADFDTDVRPWLGKDAALALFDTTTSTPTELIVVGVSRRAAAERFLAGLPTDGSASYGGTTITGHPRADDTALVGHYIVFGHSSAIRAAIDVAAGRSPSLSEDPVYRRATMAEPAGRAVDAYLSGTGVARLLAPRRGLVGELASLLYQPTLQGMAIALTPATGGVQVFVRRVLNPQLARGGSVSFSPSLPASVPAGVGLFLDATQLGKVLPRVLLSTGVGGRIPELLKRLGRVLTAEGIDVRQDIVPLFERESAVLISRHGAAPVVTLIAHTPHPGQTATVFAQLENPLVSLLTSTGLAAGQIPVFNQVTAGGEPAHQLVLAPGLQFDYAVFNDDLVLSTSLDGIAAIAHHASSILDDSAYRLTLGDHPARVTSLLFLDLNQLLSIGEQTGLLTGARYLALKPDLERVHAIGLDSTSGEAESTAELFLQIS